MSEYIYKKILNQEFLQNKHDKMALKFQKRLFRGVRGENVTSMTPLKIGFYRGALK